jgi:dipeptidyl aminopeptidase/acylaminoacyl peptidase
MRSFSFGLGAFVITLVIAFAGANVLAQTPAAPAAGPIPIEQFTKFDEFGGVKISPDGQFIAVLTGKYGRSTIVFTDLQAKKMVSGIRTPQDCEIDEYHWISPTRLIYTIAQRQLGHVQPTPTGEIFAINRDGSGSRQLYGYRAGQSTLDTHIKKREASYATPALLSSPKQDPNHILIAEYPWTSTANGWKFNPDAKPLIARLDVYSGDKKQLGMAPLGGARLLLDHDDNVRFAFGRNERQRFAVSWKPQPDSDWTGFELEGFRDESVVPRRFSADNRSVYLSGVREGETHYALYRLDLQTQRVETVHGFAGADVTGIVTDFADRELVGVSGYAERQSDFWLLADNPAAQTHQALQRAFPKQRVNVTSTSEDGRIAIVFVESDVNPGDYYLFDTVNKRADFLRAGRIWIEPRQMRPKEPITLKARDGLELHGYITRPAGDGPHPMVVMPHGGPHGVRDWWEFDEEAQLLANRGYAVLQPNFRGSGGYGMDFESAGYGEWGAKMLDDIADATRWAIQQNIAPDDRICIYGASYGGFASLMTAAREPELYRCAIGYSGVYDLELVWESGDIPDSRSGRAYLERVLGTDVAKLRAQSPVYNVQSIKAPVLLIHGKADWRADYEQAQRMKAALEKNQKKVEWLALGREGHGIYDEDTRREVYERILQFLDANLKTPQPAAAP